MKFLKTKSPVSLLAFLAILSGFTISNAAVGDTIRVNCGGSAYTDSAGHPWAADSGFVGGQTYSATSTIAGTPDQTLYQSERWDSQDFSYNFNVKTPGNYRVNLHEASLYSGVCNAGGRVFDVTINSIKVLTNYDMFNEVGCLTAQIKSYVTASPNGKINVTFNLGSASNPKIDAISIVPTTDPVAISDKLIGNQSGYSVSSSNGGISIQTQTEGAYTLELSNLQGQLLGQKHGFGYGTQSFTNLNPGLYFMTLHANHQAVTRMISVIR